MLDDGHEKENLFYQPKNTIDDDDDSGTEGIEQQFEHASITKLNDNEDKSSIKSFSPNPDEGFFESEIQHEPTRTLIKNYLELANNIPNDMKKEVCSDTKVAFHGEFARLISIPLLLYYNIYYKLFSEEEFINAPYMNLKFEYCILDNAKARFNCPNVCCQHAWTSMRARISFLISLPNTGFIVLKIFGQNCEHCGTYTHALWYIDEVCRVMKNLAMTLLELYFPDMIHNVDCKNQILIQNNTTASRQLLHDSAQRNGRMFAPHIKEYCEACQRGLCFTSKKR
ncbi:unnamed protein product [Rotaria sp. Silwood2]|nr:unnamed protein product [Rotaria sp. Silwood2]CAF2941616.1 unnamed protein product [Rotaria sp. Silwood2]CAF3145312.1 unnamed protein product [Rotaria sp. Silwood2]CAF3251625.1 unnamed protein product [Rotaria sp. Silwood2]CAF4048899.1 unnamed protein product [Rotaria sp. Silwood2]